MPDEEAGSHDTLAMTSPDGPKAVSSSSLNGVNGPCDFVLSGER